MKHKGLSHDKKYTISESPEGQEAQESQEQDEIGCWVAEAYGLAQDPVHHDSEREGDEAHPTSHKVTVV